MTHIYITVFLGLFFFNSFLFAQIFVSPDGDDNNPGTIDLPLKTIPAAITISESGDTIFLRGGIYSLTTKISVTRNGSIGSMYHLFAYQDERPILDYSAMVVNSNNRGITLSGSYWYMKGIDIKGAGDNGMNISGSNNIIEFCSFYENRDTGLQLGNGASNNSIINCDSYFNVDPGQGNADGFAPKLTVGTNNYFYGCRAWQNSDDGWDGYLRGADNASTIVENSWCFANGYLKDGSPSSGNGNGYKMGGGDNGNSANLAHDFTLIKSLAFDNRVKGFDQNNNRGSMTLYNCSAYRNGTNYSIPSSINSGETATIINGIALGSSGSLAGFVVQQTNSWQSPFSVDNDDFISIDTLGVRGPRNADGSLPDLDFMHLTSGSDVIDAGTDVGLPYNGSAPDLGAFETEENPIPVELTSLTAKVNKERNVVLNWSTATEVNNHMFELERKNKDGLYATIGFAEGYGTTAEQQEYSYIDNSVLTGIYYYRLKQIDFSGQYAYSDEVEVVVYGPVTFSLQQNYPNPFNPSTKIIYYINVPGNVKIEVFDILGRKVNEIVNDFQQPGKYEIEWTAKDLTGHFLPSGTYIVTMQLINQVQSMKISLLK